MSAIHQPKLYLNKHRTLALDEEHNVTVENAKEHSEVCTQPDSMLAGAN